MANVAELRTTAADLESVVENPICILPRQEAVAFEAAGAATVAMRKCLIANAADFARRWPTLSASEMRAILQALVERVDVRPEFGQRLGPAGGVAWCRKTRSGGPTSADKSRRCDQSSVRPGSAAADRYGNETLGQGRVSRRIIVPNQWRRGWDSNPRWACTHAGFQDRCLKPLGHPSGLAADPTPPCRTSQARQAPTANASI